MLSTNFKSIVKDCHNLHKNHVNCCSHFAANMAQSSQLLTVELNWRQLNTRNQMAF